MRDLWVGPLGGTRRAGLISAFITKRDIPLSLGPVLYGIAAATAALFLAALLAALLRAPARRLGLLDRRRAGGPPVPLLGGVAVVLTTVGVAGAGHWTGLAALDDDTVDLLAAGSAVALLGLAADVWRLRARVAAGGTAVAAACVMPYEETGLVGGVAAVVWVTVVAVAFRAFDHGDGLAGTIGMVTVFGVAVCASVEVMDGLATLLSVQAAALTGFLMHNWPPARIALGACGSLFTGFVAAGAAVLVRAGYEPLTSAAVLFALAAVVCADIALVLLGRRLAGRPVHRPAPDHVTHRLRRLGLTGRGVTLVVGVAASGGVAVGVLVHGGWMRPGAVWWVAGAAGVVVLGLLRVRVGVPGGGRPGAATGVRAVPGGRRPGGSGPAGGGVRVPQRRRKAAAGGGPGVPAGRTGAVAERRPGATGTRPAGKGARLRSARVRRLPALMRRASGGPDRVTPAGGVRRAPTGTRTAPAGGGRAPAPAGAYFTAGSAPMVSRGSLRTPAEPRGTVRAGGGSGGAAPRARDAVSGLHRAEERVRVEMSDSGVGPHGSAAPVAPPVAPVMRPPAPHQARTPAVVSVPSTRTAAAARPSSPPPPSPRPSSPAAQPPRLPPRPSRPEGSCV